MKKTLKLGAILVLGLFMLSGCMLNSEVNVKKDGSGDITYVIALTDQELQSVQDIGYDKSQLIQPNGYDETTGVTVNQYNENGLQGNVYTKHFDDIAKFDIKEIYGGTVVTPYDSDPQYAVTDGTNNTAFPPQFTVTKNIFVTKVVLDANLDISGSNYSSYNVSQDYNFKISTKGGIVKNTNAATKTLGTCEWKLNFNAYDTTNPNSANSLKATIYFINYFLIGGILLGIIVIVVAVIIVLRFMKKKNKTAEEIAAEKQVKQANKESKKVANKENRDKKKVKRATNKENKNKQKEENKVKKAAKENKVKDKTE